jgi:hypothetical protein
VIALVGVPSAASSTPAPPPASCPCFPRTTNGTCPGYRVPVTLTTLDDNQNNGMSLQQASSGELADRGLWSFWLCGCCALGVGECEGGGLRVWRR